MKQWPGIYYCKDYGNVIVREHTDKECTKFRKNGTNQVPISMGFVCLYWQAGKDDYRFAAWAGTNWCKKKLRKID